MTSVWHRAQSHPLPVVGFMPTPFDADGTVHQQRLAGLAEVLGRSGIRPAVLGGMGEFYALDLAESRDCMDAAVAGARDVPTVAGVGYATRAAVRLAAQARDAGISLIVVNPHYYAVPKPDGMAQHVRAVCEESGLPAVVYSSATHPLTDAHIDQLVEVPGFHGIKEEAYGPSESEKRIARWGDRIEWWGVTEPVGMDYVAVGATVVTSGMASVSPVASWRYIEARLSGGREGVVHTRAGEFAAAWDDYLAGAREGTQGALKAMMEALYDWPDAVRSPMCPPGAETKASARTFLERFSDFLLDPVTR